MTRLEWPAQLTDTSLRVYRHAMSRGRLDVGPTAAALALSVAEVRQACAELSSLRLLSPAPEPDSFTPVRPERARALASKPLVDEILVRRSAIEFANQQLARASAALAGAAKPVQEGAGLRVVADPGQAQQEINEIVLHCAEELLVMQPGGPRSPLPEFVDLDLPHPDARCRMLHQHTVRANLGLRTYARAVTERGGQVRTTAEGLERMVLVDGRVAILPLAPPTEPASGSVILTHAPVVEFLRRNFERSWTGAVPYADDREQYEEISAEIRISLLRLMAAGLKDEAVAHRLGLATRTCRRYVAAIMEDLNVTSRFQAGMRIAQLGLLPLNEDKPLSTRLGDSYPWW